MASFPHLLTFPSAMLAVCRPSFRPCQCATGPYPVAPSTALRTVSRQSLVLISISGLSLWSTTLSHVSANDPRGRAGLH
jgi:hypothetical protein